MSWNIWQISQIVTKTWDRVKECPKWWNWSWSWGITARGSYFALWSTRVILQMELLRSNSKLGSLIILSGIFHTGDESLQDDLEDVQICGIILASAYVLHYLFATWLKFQIRERSLSWKWVLIWYVAIEHQESSSIRIIFVNYQTSKLQYNCQEWKK